MRKRCARRRRIGDGIVFLLVAGVKGMSQGGGGRALGGGRPGEPARGEPAAATGFAGGAPMCVPGIALGGGGRRPGEPAGEK